MGAMKQMDRRLLILMRLREERPLRAADLADECECSVRTIYRDIDALCQSGVPVAAMPGEGYRIVEGYHLPPIAFTVDEAMQLLMGSELALGLGTDEQRSAVRSAAAKVEAVLADETRREVERMRERIRVASDHHREASPWLPILQRGVIQERVLHLRYHSFSADEVTERDVEPYFLVFYGGDWHLVGYCRLRESIRDFRCGRIREANLTPEEFERPDHVGQWHDGPRPPRQEVHVWIEAASVPWARETRGYGFRREEPTEGGALFVFEADDLKRLLPWIMSWGMGARVLSPPELGRRILREAEALVQAYAEG
jgi:predicted DNA-binding transcriptional regulator YafY